jgi:hypothetical protein
MFTAQAISQARSPVSISRHPTLVAWVALLTTALAALIVVLALKSSPATSLQVRSARPLPQLRDTPPSPALAVQILRASTPAGYVRDARAHALLLIQAGS